MTIVRLDSVESTNRYCEALDLSQVGDFTCYWALAQTAGIGQRGNHWHSSPGLNLTFSLVLKPTFLPADRQFRLTQALSLALVDLLSCFNIQQPIQIKWPNDIYVGMSTTTAGSERQHYDRKICGTLTTAHLTDGHLASAVCGIGLNVNETDFPSWVPNPTSLRLLTGQHYDLEPLLRQLLLCIQRRYEALRRGADIEAEYLALLLGRGETRQYMYQGQRLTAVIDGVDPYGRLLLTAADGTSLCCNLKEIAFLS